MPVDCAKEQIPDGKLRHFGPCGQPVPVRMEIEDLAGEDNRVRRIGDVVQPGQGRVGPPSPGEGGNSETGRNPGQEAQNDQRAPPLPDIGRSP